MLSLSSLLLLLIAARLLGHLFTRSGQPSLVGEILAGILLGPSVLGLIHGDPLLAGVSDAAVFLIVLSAGLEMRCEHIREALRGRGLILTLAGFALPFLSGWLAGAAFGLGAPRAVFLGICVSVTALPVAVRILKSFNIVDTVIGRHTVATAIVNDLIAVAVLAAVLDLPPGKTLTVIGVFLAALILGRKFLKPEQHEDLQQSLGSAADNFLAPLFFAYIGLTLDFGHLGSPAFVAAVIAVSAASKILAGWLGGRLAGLSPKDSLGIGIMLNGRGIMELAIASLAFRNGFIGQDLFSALVLMGVLTTLMTPVLFRRYAMPAKPGRDGLNPEC